MKLKNLTLVMLTAIIALSFGYGLGRGLSTKTMVKNSEVDMRAYAASTEAKSELTQVFVHISKKMIPSVVNIFTTAIVRAPWSGRGGENGPGSPDEMWRRFFEEFFGEPFNGGPGGQGSPAQKAQSLGSGFIIETSSTGGLILTNNHVVEGADEIKVKFTEAVDEKESDAELVGRDPDLDIALIRVKTRRKLEAAKLSDSNELEVGEWVGAVGNPFGHGHSVSHGIVSAKERTLPGGFGKYLQVDAPINPGNSGGPLVNLNGEVVGINNAIDARGPGIGFAIPINLVKSVLPQLKQSGKVERGYIGVSVDELRPDLAKSLKLDEGIKAPIITNVMPGQPAAKAGLQAYDVITEVAGQVVHTAADLVSAVTAVPIGTSAKVKILRSGKEKEISVLVVKRPEFKNERGGRGAVKPSKPPKPPKVDTGMVLEQIDPDVARELGLPESYNGIVVSQVMPGGPAYSAGLMRGDVILEVDRKVVKTIEAFQKVVNAKKTYLLRVRKQDEAGRETFAVATLKLASSDAE